MTHQLSDHKVGALVVGATIGLAYVGYKVLEELGARWLVWLAGGGRSTR